MEDTIIENFNKFCTNNNLNTMQKLKIVYKYLQKKIIKYNNNRGNILEDEENDINMDSDDDMIGSVSDIEENEVDDEVEDTNNNIYYSTSESIYSSSDCESSDESGDESGDESSDEANPTKPTTNNLDRFLNNTNNLDDILIYEKNSSYTSKLNSYLQNTKFY